MGQQMWPINAGRPVCRPLRHRWRYTSIEMTTATTQTPVTAVEAAVEATTLPAERLFDPAAVLTMAGGHFVHDSFASFLSPLLPLLIQKLGLSLTLAGSLSALQSFPSLINPLLG